MALYTGGLINGAITKLRTAWAYKRGELIHRGLKYGVIRYFANININSITDQKRFGKL